jgi:hypothetical protein
VLGDISRRHAKIHRRGESYFVEPLQTTRLAGREVSGSTLLTNGDEITLGRNVQFRFRQPNALSASATLTLISHHRTQPSSDSILLMGESCILGPSRSSHIVCAPWTREVILFRRGAELFVRANESLIVDGEQCNGKSRLTRRSRVIGEEFSLSLEELS